MFKSAVTAFIPHPTNSELYLAVSRKTDPNDMGLVGGKVNGHPCETHRDALSRELKEETGLTLASMRPVLTRRDGKFIVYAYTVEVVEDLNKPLSDIINTTEKGVVRWVSAEKLISGSFGAFNKKLLGIVNFNVA